MINCNLYRSISTIKWSNEWKPLNINWWIGSLLVAISGRWSMIIDCSCHNNGRVDPREKACAVHFACRTRCFPTCNYRRVRRATPIQSCWLIMNELFSNWVCTNHPINSLNVTVATVEMSRNYHWNNVNFISIKTRLLFLYWKLLLF